MNESFFSSVLEESFGPEAKLISTRSIGGGCINNGTRLTTSEGTFFLKWNGFDAGDLFEKESHGLKLLSGAGPIKVPDVIRTGLIGSYHYLMQEFVDQSAPSGMFWEDFGHSLAELHRHTSKEFGLDVSNHIGRLDQKNNWKANWIDFFIENRLEVQLRLAMQNGYIDSAYAKKLQGLYAQLPELLSEEPPSLIHGDLWSGNFMVGPDGKACIFDPAVYFGNREIEVSFTRMFGGYDQRFYDAYFEAWPVEKGFEDRIDIYNLYPYLVHVNLFGTSYLSGIQTVIRRYC